MKNVSNTCGNHEKLLTAAYDMQDRMWGLSISAAGHTASALPCKQVNNAKKAPTEYTLVCIAYGSGYLNNNINNHKPVETGDIILLFPGEEYTLTPGNEGYNIYWVEFGGYAIDNIVRNNFFSDKKNIFQANDLHHIIDTFEEILKTMDSGRNGRQQYAGGLVYMLLGKLYYCAQNDNTDEGYMLRIISLAKSIMKNEAQMHLPMDVIAQELGISYSLFRRESRLKSLLLPLTEPVKLFLTGGNVVRKTYLDGFQLFHHLIQSPRKIVCGGCFPGTARSP